MICRSKYNKQLSYFFNIDKDNKIHMSHGDFKTIIDQEMFNDFFEIVDENNDE